MTERAPRPFADWEYGVVRRKPGFELLDVVPKYSLVTPEREGPFGFLESFRIGRSDGRAVSAATARLFAAITGVESWVPLGFLLCALRRSEDGADVAELQTAAIKEATKAIPRDENYDRTLADVERAVQTPPRGSPRANAILIIEVLRYYETNEPEVGGLDSTASRIWRDYMAERVEAAEALLRLLRGPVDEGLRTQVQDFLAAQKTYLSGAIRLIEATKRRRKRPKKLGMTYETAVKLLWVAGLEREHARSLLRKK